jgi:choline dehydrogenase
VKHYADEERQARDYKTSYQTPDGGIYTGLDPPAGSEMKGTLYPRTGTLGGCTAHNALIAVYPHRSDFDNIAALTGDASWSADNMRKYFMKLEDNHYLLPGQKGHGYEGWLDTSFAPIDIVLTDPKLLSIVTGATFALGNQTNAIVNLASLLAGDANSAHANRDSQPAVFQIPISTGDGKRSGSREFVVAVRDAKTASGAKAFPLGEFTLWSSSLEDDRTNVRTRCENQLPRYQDHFRQVYPSSCHWCRVP